MCGFRRADLAHGINKTIGMGRSDLPSLTRMPAPAPSHQTAGRSNEYPFRLFSLVFCVQVVGHTLLQFFRNSSDALQQESGQVFLKNPAMFFLVLTHGFCLNPLVRVFRKESSSWHPLKSWLNELTWQETPNSVFTCPRSRGVEAEGLEI